MKLSEIIVSSYARFAGHADVQKVEVSCAKSIVFRCSTMGWSLSRTLPKQLMVGPGPQVTHCNSVCHAEGFPVKARGLTCLQGLGLSCGQGLLCLLPCRASTGAQGGRQGGHRLSLRGRRWAA